MKTQVVTGILVKNAENKILLVKKPAGVGPYPGTYLTPGGGVKDGETADEGVRRELFEETGVTATNIRRVVFDEDMTGNWKGEIKHFIMLLYTGEYVSGDLKPTAGDDDNLEVIEWYDSAEISRLPLSPPLAKLIAYLGKWKNKLIFSAGMYVPDPSQNDL